MDRLCFLLNCVSPIVTFYLQWRILWGTNPVMTPSSLVIDFAPFQRKN